MTECRPAGSASLDQPDYWWYRARSGLLRAVLADYVGSPARLLDVGSADGPSVGWMQSDARIPMDIDARGLDGGRGVCASALSLPFPAETFDVVAAFDVLEHCQPESVAMDEFSRVLVPGGRLLMSVPAYQWAWTDHDVRASHYRRYTRARLVDAVERGGLTVERSTYAFGSVFPFFAAERLAQRIRPQREGAPRLPSVPAAVERLLIGLTGTEERVLRKHDVPFGSSVVVVAVKPKTANG